jgi:glycosyltransferase involved in cell wall biosynthesis
MGSYSSRNTKGRFDLISVIATVLNEGDNIRRLMDSLVAQTCQPADVVIVDGGSHDQTVDVLHEYEDRLPLRVIVAPGSSISAGRNQAISAARHDIIAVTDAGVILNSQWLERITRPLRDDDSVEVVGGFFRADPHNLFEAAMGATVLPLADEIDPNTFLPSSRSVAFRKSAWEAVGGYPEWLDYCEDLIFDLRLKAISAPQVFEKDALVYFRPRQSLGAFFKQYYLYARGDGKADLWRKRHLIRYATYLLAAPLLLLMGARSRGIVRLLTLFIFGAGLGVYLNQPYRRLRRVLREATSIGKIRITLWSNLEAIGLVPVIRVLGDVAKMIGYPVGWWWRLKHKPQDWREL